MKNEERQKKSSKVNIYDSLLFFIAKNDIKEKQMIKSGDEKEPCVSLKSMEKHYELLYLEYIKTINKTIQQMRKSEYIEKYKDIVDNIEFRMIEMNKISQEIRFSFKEMREFVIPKEICKGKF